VRSVRAKWLEQLILRPGPVAFGDHIRFAARGPGAPHPPRAAASPGRTRPPN